MVYRLGFFGKIGLLPSLFKARKNPDGKTLQQILPPATYQRWLLMKRKYIGDDKGIESFRPIFAAQELYEKAIAKAGLSEDGIVWPKAEKLAKRADVLVFRPEIKVNIGDPKQFIKTFNRNALNDVACFEKTLDSIERDVQFMAARAAESKPRASCSTRRSRWTLTMRRRWRRRRKPCCS